MKEEKNKKIELEQVLKGSKLTASENLQYRIMQQIKTENALAKKQAKQTDNLRPMMSIVFVLALMLGGATYIGIYAYMKGNIDIVLSSTYLAPIVFVSVICSAYGIISILDEKRFWKKKS